MRATIKPLDKGFMLMLGDHELGFSKTDVDARVHMHRINDALDARYALAAPAPKSCKVTGNPCGTDTWMVGHPCKCENCQEWLRAAPKPAPPAEPTDRQFAYRFLEMPNHEQWAIARQYGATSEKDADLPDSELFVVWIKRLRERGKLDEFKAEILRRAAERKP